MAGGRTPTVALVGTAIECPRVLHEVARSIQVNIAPSGRMGVPTDIREPLDLAGDVAVSTAAPHNKVIVTFQRI
jgi:hypothetical protein